MMGLNNKKYHFCYTFLIGILVLGLTKKADCRFG